MSLSSAANLAPLPASAYSRLIGQEKWALAQHLLLKGPISFLIATQNQISCFKFTLCPGGATRVGENTLYPLSLCNKKGKFLLRAKLLPPLLWLAHCFGVFGDRDAQPGFWGAFGVSELSLLGLAQALGAVEMHILDVGLPQLPRAAAPCGSAWGCCNHQETPTLCQG